MNRSTSDEPGAASLTWQRPDAGVGGLRLGPIDGHDAALALLFVIEALVFYAQLADRITPFHPASYDQVSYMVETYRLIDGFTARGWSELFAPIVHPHAPNGVSFTVQGALLTPIGGCDRRDFPRRGSISTSRTKITAQ